MLSTVMSGSIEEIWEQQRPEVQTSPAVTTRSNMKI